MFNEFTKNWPKPTLVKERKTPMTCEVCEVNKIKEDVEKAALETEKPILAGIPAAAIAFQQEHDRQKEDFGFECARFADFLNIKVERKANPEHTHGDGAIYSGAINLGAVKNILFKEGSPSGLNNTISYRIGREHGDALNARGEFYYPLHDGDRWVVTPDDIPAPPRSRRIWARAGEWQQHGNLHVCNGFYKALHITKGYPSKSEDDEIIFEGTGTLFIPHGLGDGVYKKILRAKDGFK